VRGLLGLAALAVLLGCAGDGSPLGTESEASITGIVGPDGGIVRLGNRITVVFPPGALSAPIAITIRAADPPEFLTAAGGFGPAFRIEPEGLVLDVAAEVTILVPDEVLEGLPPNIPPGLFLLVTSAHPLSMGPSAFWYLQVRSRASAPDGLVLTSQTLHLGPVQAALPNVQ
jgi:hypothetical protein